MGQNLNLRIAGVGPLQHTIMAAASRLECRLHLELALEARFPRLICKKPVCSGQPVGASPRAPFS